MANRSFTVVTPVFNRADCIARCIESVVKQHYPNVEHWIVDDGSTDATAFIIEEYESKYPFIRSHRFEKNRGVNAARNYAIQNSSKDFIIFLDSDDCFVENALNTVNQTIAMHPEYHHYLFAQDDMMNSFQQNPLLRRETAELTFYDFLTGKVSGDFLHVMAAPLLSKFPFNEQLRIYEGLTFLSIYKAEEKQFFTKQALVVRDRGRADSVTKEYLLQSTDAIQKQHQALKEQLLRFEADYRQFGAHKELKDLKCRIFILKYGWIFKPVIFAWSFVKSSLKSKQR
jgi:glycosyltransferase involved in cell wall biosynthesis